MRKQKQLFFNNQEDSEMKRIALPILLCILCGFTLFTGCGKQESPPAVNPPPTNPPVNPPPTNPKNCIVSGISQTNTGTKSDFVLSVSFNSNDAPTKFLVYDSLANTKIFEANLTYITTDSIRLDQYQYIKLDASKRVSVFVTKSDMSIPTTADDYKFMYIYNNDGYLITKYLYINGSATPFQTTSYTYTNNLLTKCVMTAGGNNSLKILEADLLYDNNSTLKNWIYTFPDAFESNVLNTALSFGNKANKALTSIVTKIYNPANGNILDTWTTNYGSYTFNADGYLTSINATGDLQQGIVTCYGKTVFTYTCK